jgi:hypothetical protein
MNKPMESDDSEVNDVITNEKRGSKEQKSEVGKCPTPSIERRAATM